MMIRLISTLPDFVLEDLKKVDKEEAEELRIARADADGLIEALKQVGLWVEDLWEFRNTNDRYPEAIPVLIAYLPKLKVKSNIEAVIRALSVKEAKGIACKAVIAAYHRGDKMRLNHHSVCGTNLRATLTMDYIDDVVEIIDEADQLVAQGGNAGRYYCFCISDASSISYDD